MNFTYKGRCWKFGDDIGVDGDLMPLEFAIQRETRIEERFAQGNPHIQGLLGIAGLKMGLVVESIPRGSLRNAVNAGLPILPACPDVTKHCETGDELEVDFATGRFTNLTQGKTLQFEPLEAQLRDIIALGGQRPALQKRIAEMMASRG
jgi:3-isopropylmalate/(R)-2-methylmalate dehydratase small subunit